MSAAISRLVSKAEQSARAGRRDAAERTWMKVLDLEPEHTQALAALGTIALESGDTKRALRYLEAARVTAPTDLHVLTALCSARRAAGDDEGEFEAIQWALAVDSSFMAALLLKGAWYERHGDAGAACDVYSRALENAAPEQRWPAQYRSQLSHARAFVAGYTRALHEFLDREISRAAPEDTDTRTGRWREAASIRAGRSLPFESRPRQLHVPRLPAIPFLDPAQFVFLGELAANTRAIRDEAMAMSDRHNELLEPVIALAPGEPVAQWQPLNHSTRWTALHLWRDGFEVGESQSLCPKTQRTVGALPLCDIPAMSPNVFIFVLAPATQVPPHHGETNARVTVYLPLVAIDDARLRVGYEERRLEEGEILVFDDTVEHEITNSGSRDCVVLVFDVVHPLLDAPDREMVNALQRAVRSVPVAS